MAKEGLIFLMNIYPQANDKFVKIVRYRYIAPFSKKEKTIIDLEIYEPNICLISFFQSGKGNDESRYKLRLNLKPGHVLAILKNCLEAFYQLQPRHALIFLASDDIGEKAEANDRFSAYSLFMSRYLLDYQHYEKIASTALNLMLLQHEDFTFKEEAIAFFNQYEQSLIDEFSS